MTLCTRVRTEPDSQMQVLSGVWKKKIYQALNCNNIQEKKNQNYSRKLGRMTLLNYADAKTFLHLLHFGE